jgi:hypothetical protein
MCLLVLWQYLAPRRERKGQIVKRLSGSSSQWTGRNLASVLLIQTVQLQDLKKPIGDKKMCIKTSWVRWGQNPRTHVSWKPLSHLPLTVVLNQIPIWEPVGNVYGLQDWVFSTFPPACADNLFLWCWDWIQNLALTLPLSYIPRCSTDDLDTFSKQGKEEEWVGNS